MRCRKGFNCTGLDRETNLLTPNRVEAPSRIETQPQLKKNECERELCFVHKRLRRVEYLTTMWGKTEETLKKGEKFLFRCRKGQTCTSREHRTTREAGETETNSAKEANIPASSSSLTSERKSEHPRPNVGQCFIHKIKRPVSSLRRDPELNWRYRCTSDACCSKSCETEKKNTKEVDISFSSSPSLKSEPKSAHRQETESQLKKNECERELCFVHKRLRRVEYLTTMWGKTEETLKKGEKLLFRCRKGQTCTSREHRTTQEAVETETNTAKEANSSLSSSPSTSERKSEHPRPNVGQCFIHKIKRPVSSLRRDPELNWRYRCTSDACCSKSCETEREATKDAKVPLTSSSLNMERKSEHRRPNVGQCCIHMIKRPVACLRRDPKFNWRYRCTSDSCCSELPK